MEARFKLAQLKLFLYSDELIVVYSAVNNRCTDNVA